MAHLVSENHPPPTGDSEKPAFPSKTSWPVDTPGGRVHAEWADDVPVTREGSLVFFFQFLAASDRWKELMKEIPLHFSSNHASAPQDVFGTLFLSVLHGHWRYAHIDSVRGDGVNPGLLGMHRTVSEDVVRRSLRRMDSTAALAWLEKNNLTALSPILWLPWILDIENTVKALYGHQQQGAELGYNPQKPGRPSHNYHSYFVANIRLCLGVEVTPGKRSAAKEGLPGLWRLLRGLRREHWPTMIRGDCAYGSETILSQCEQHELPYLFKLKHTLNVKKLVQECLRQNGWQEAGDGWQYLEAKLQLQGWSKARRVILTRESPALAPVGQQSRRRRDPYCEELGQGEGWDAKPTPWSGRIAVLVTSEKKDGGLNALTKPRLYRERADAENIIDEIKNQWGWCGYTTRSLGGSSIAATFIALVYNWWHLYVRFYDEEHNREAITTRPELMQGVARRVESGGQKSIRVSILHRNAEALSAAITAISKEISHIAATAQQWDVEQRWMLFIVRIYRRYFGGKRPVGFLPETEKLLSG